MSGALVLARKVVFLTSSPTTPFSCGKGMPSNDSATCETSIVPDLQTLGLTSNDAFEVLLSCSPRRILSSLKREDPRKITRSRIIREPCCRADLFLQLHHR